MNKEQIEKRIIVLENEIFNIKKEVNFLTRTIDKLLKDESQNQILIKQLLIDTSNSINEAIRITKEDIENSIIEKLKNSYTKSCPKIS